MSVELGQHIRLFRPEGAGPFPAIAQFHGCGGLTPLQFDYAQAAVAQGLIVAVVDSFTPRGIGRVEATATICTGLRLRGRERSADIATTLDWLALQPGVDSARLGVAGWSHGGWSVMEALAHPNPPERVRNLAFVGLIYPYCGLAASTAKKGWGARKPPVFACLAGRDQVVGRRGPLAALARLEADGIGVERLEFPDATHAFDDQFASDPRSQWRPDLACIAHDRYAKAAARALGSMRR